jgi:hypothetical protein
MPLLFLLFVKKKKQKNKNNNDPYGSLRIPTEGFLQEKKAKQPCRFQGFKLSSFQAFQQKKSLLLLKKA